MAIKTLLQGKGAGGLYNMLMQSNPQFAQFVKENQGKSVEQIASDYGINPDDLAKVLR